MCEPEPAAPDATLAQRELSNRTIESMDTQIERVLLATGLAAEKRGKLELTAPDTLVVVIGDNAKEHPRWKAIRQHSVNYQTAFNAAGGKLDLVDLPDVGIKGNSHMVMMDKNSDRVADLIQRWLVRKGLGRN